MNQAFLIASAKKGEDSDDSKSKSLFMPRGLGFFEVASIISNASTACPMNSSVFPALRSSPGFASEVNAFMTSTLQVSQVHCKLTGITFLGAFMSGRLISIECPFRSPSSHNWSVTPISWTYSILVECENNQG